MAFTKEQIEGNAAYFRARLQAVKQKADAVHWVKGEPTEDFVLADVRGRDVFHKEHVQGSICLPENEIPALAAQLPRDKPIVTFCWNHL